MQIATPTCASGGTQSADRLESAGSALKQMVPELVVSKQKLRQAEGSCLVRIKREEKKQNFGVQFPAVCLVRIAGPQTMQRANCCSSVETEFRPSDHRTSQFGLPFGQDRLVPIYLATLAVQQKSQTVRFRSGCRNARDVRDAERRQGVQAAGRQPSKGSSAQPSSSALTHMAGKAKLVQRSRFNFFRRPRSGTAAIRISVLFPMSSRM